MWFKKNAKKCLLQCGEQDLKVEGRGLCSSLGINQDGML